MYQTKKSWSRAKGMRRKIGSASGIPNKKPFTELKAKGGTGNNKHTQQKKHSYIAEAKGGG